MKGKESRATLRKKKLKPYDEMQLEIQELIKTRHTVDTDAKRELINRRILELNREQLKLGGVEC